MFKLMLTTVLMMVGLAGLAQLNEITQPVRMKQVKAREAICKEVLCSTDEEIHQAVDWLESHGYSGIAADKVAANMWKVYGSANPDNLEDYREASTTWLLIH